MGSRIARREAISVGDAILEALRSSRLGSAHNTQRIYEAWDKVSGAGKLTLKRFFRDGKLYVTLSSSAARGMLLMQKDVLIAGINAELDKDPLYYDNDTDPVRELILR